jgi:hypothetical protein
MKVSLAHVLTYRPLTPHWQRLRTLLYDLTVHNAARGALGEETVFDFKYIPSPDMTFTPLGDVPAPGRVPRGVEGRNLRALLAAAVVVAFVAWLGVRAGSAVLAG